MTRTPSGWVELDAGRGLWMRSYSIGPGNSTNCVVARFGDGQLLVVSPSTHPSDEALRELDALGRVTALIAPNGFHRSGTPHWRRAFPDARVFAPERALPRVRKVARDAAPLSELAPALPPELTLASLPRMRFGETWLLAQTARGPLWAVSDTLTNIHRHPTGMGWLLRGLGIGLGFGLNGAQARWMALDRPAFGDWLRRTLDGGAPIAVLPAHGDLVERPDLPEQLRAIFAAPP